MTLLLLIRHADNDQRKVRLCGRLPGIHLNSHGREQAEGLAKDLGEAPIQAIYSSPMERAVETATPLSVTLKLPLQVVDDLNETDYGQWQGRTFRQLRRLKGWQTVLKTPSQVRFPDGETLLEVQQRTVAALEKLSQGDKLIAVFTHADLIRLAMAHYLNIPLDDFSRLTIRPASLSIVALKDGIVHVLLINQTRDLYLLLNKPENSRPVKHSKKLAVNKP